MNRYESYLNSMHKLGRISGAIALLIIFGVPVLTCWKFNIFPPTANILTGLSTLLVIFIPMCIIDVIMYTPMAGTGGSYLLFVTGNLTNLRIPAMMLCMETAGVQSATEEGEVITTLAIAASALTTTIIIGLGVLLLVPLTPVLNDPTLKPGFDNILPALFGALAVAWMSSSANGFPQWKVALLPLALSTFIVMAMGGHAGKMIAVLIPVMGAVSILFARYMYKRDWMVTAATQS